MSEYLYQKIETAFEEVEKPQIPQSITNNLKNSLRDYQVDALINFIFFNEFSKKYKDLPNKHLLFHMATGSGKTQIIASCILYLYEKGYRNFVFFTNANSIIEKTIGNFFKDGANPNSYLFTNEIMVGKKHIRTNQISGSFDMADKDAINILFTSVQQLHLDLLTPKENRNTLESIKANKVVLIADEAHHINAGNKKSKTAQKEEKTWTETVKKLLKVNSENMLLEFTATAGYESNEELKKHYVDKVIFDFTFDKFDKAGYAKNIWLAKSEFDDTFRIIQALMLSEYRVLLAEHPDINQAIKPVVMFKNMKGTDSADENIEIFQEIVDGITLDQLNEIFRVSDLAAIKKLQQKIKGNEESFISRIKRGFRKENCVTIHSKKENKKEILTLLNRLENSDNNIRAIFAVDMLNEGWDVKNLYDIVKLDETSTSGKSTTADVQLIGRGARYYPFHYKPTENDPEMKYKRKFDSSNELAELEKMYFHSKNDSQYIATLLFEIDKIMPRKKRAPIYLKESFKNTNLYKEGVVYTNLRGIVESDAKSMEFYDENWKTSYVKIDNNSSEFELRQKQEEQYTQREPIILANEDKHAIRYILNQNGLSFSALKSYLPELKSVDEFITQKKYLGGITIIPSTTAPMDEDTKEHAIIETIERLTQAFERKSTYFGSIDFHPHTIRETLKDGYDVVVDEAIKEKGDWFVYEEAFGNSYEKAFVKFIGGIMPKLEAKFSNIKLIRNELNYTIYDFEDGNGFSPDYILMLTKDNCTYQIFCEMKGEQIEQKDGFKEKFMDKINELTDKDKLMVIESYKDGTVKYQIGCYKIHGTKFYQPNNQSKFDNSLNEVIKYR